MGCVNSKPIAVIAPLGGGDQHLDETVPKVPATEPIKEPLDNKQPDKMALSDKSIRPFSRPPSPDVVGELPCSERSTWHISDGISSQSSRMSLKLPHARRSNISTSESRSTILSITLVESVTEHQEPLVPINQGDTISLSLSSPTFDAEASHRSSHASKYGKNPLSKASKCGYEDKVLPLVWPLFGTGRASGSSLSRPEQPGTDT